MKTPPLPLTLALGLAAALCSACAADPAGAVEVVDDATADAPPAPGDADAATTDAAVEVDVAPAPALPPIDKALYFSPDVRDGVIAVQPTLAWGVDGRLLVAWTGAADAELGVFAGTWSVDGNGVTAGRAAALVNTDHLGLRNEPAACALAGGGFALAWSLDRQDGEDNLGIDYRRLDAAGLALDAADQHLLTDRAGNHWLADVACRPGGGFAIAGVRAREGGGGFEVFAQPFAADGGLAGPALVALARATGSQAFPAIAAGPADALWVAWEDTPAVNDKTVVALRRLAPTPGDRQVVAASVTKDAQAPVLAVDPVSGHALAGGVVGTTLRLALDIGASDPVVIALPEAASDVTTVAAAAAIDVDRFGVLWFRGTGAAVDVRYAELADGAFGAVTTLATGSFPLAYRPALATRGDRVAAAWTESVGGGHYAVRAAVFGR